MKLCLLCSVIFGLFSGILGISFNQVLDLVVGPEDSGKVERDVPGSFLRSVKCRGNIIYGVDKIDFNKLTGDWYEISKTQPFDPQRHRLTSGKWRIMRGLGTTLDFTYTAKIDKSRCLHPIEGTIEANPDVPGEWQLNYRIWGPIIREDVRVIYLDPNYNTMVLYLCQHVRGDDGTCDPSATTVVHLSSKKYPENDWNAAATQIMRDACVDTTLLELQNTQAVCTFAFKDQDPAVSLPEICKQDVKYGMCSGSFQRYFYNQTSKNCLPFKYGGCGGNDNNFLTIQDCQHHCINFSSGETCKPAPCGILCPDCCGTMQDGCIECKCPVQISRNAQQSSPLRTGPGLMPYHPKIFLIAASVECPSKCRVEMAQQKYCNCTNVELCSLPFEDEECQDGAVPGYGYNVDKEVCQAIPFGGCNKNKNRFSNLIDCSNSCEDVCQQPPEVGPCKANMQRFYFDYRENKCRTFIYGGCQGNGNNFETLRECEDRCKDVCMRERDPGNCTNFEKRFYFHHEAGQCHEFEYGGCYGNANNFRDIQECMKRCPENPRPIRTISIKTEELEKCYLPPEEGLCSGDKNDRLPRYYYNARLGECLKFYFSGCSGNENNFKAKEVCIATCHDVTRRTNLETEDDSNKGSNINGGISSVISFIVLNIILRFAIR